MRVAHNSKFKIPNARSAQFKIQNSKLKIPYVKLSIFIIIL